MLLKNPKAILGFDDRLLVLIGIILNTHLVMAIYYTGSFFEVKFTLYAITWLGEFFAILILWIVIRYFYLKVLARFSGLKHLRKRILIFPLFLIPYIGITAGYITYIQHLFRWNLPEYPEPSMALQLFFGAFVLFIDVSIYEALHLFVELKDAKIKEQKVEKENITAQLINLKNQISPHFLFNSLNTLIYLIDTDKEKSKEFVHKLASIYKTILEISEHNLVSLKDELDYNNSYIELLKERFGENIVFNFDIPHEDKRKKIVSLSLLFGIENAVKHNVITKKRPLTINLLTENGYLIIINNLQKKVPNASTKGIGLDNISKRYHLLSKSSVITQISEGDFILKLPLLNE